jgi:hypothetical protein
MDYKTILRQYLAMLAFRTGYALSDTGDSYHDFDAGFGVKTPRQIMLHMANLMKVPVDHLEIGKFTLYESENWDDIIKEFYNQMERLDKIIADLTDPDEEKLIDLFQGPICDAMAHVGQLLTLRRMNGNPIDGKLYWKEKIEIGKFKYNY